MDWGIWWAIVHGIAKSWIRLSKHAHTHTHARAFNTLTQEWQYFQTYLCWVLSWGVLGIIEAVLFTCNITGIWGFVLFTWLSQDDRAGPRTQVSPLPALIFTPYFMQLLISTRNFICAFILVKHFAIYWNSKDEMKSKIVITVPEGQHAAFALVLNSWISGKRLW